MPRLRIGLATAAVVLALAGCGTTPPPGTPADPTPTAVATADDGATTQPTPDETSASTSLHDAVIEPDGVGPIRIGVSLAEAQAHGWVARDEVCNDWDASPELIDQGLSLTFVDDQLYEIWVHKPTFATSEGTKVGNTLDDVKKAYGNDLRTEEREGGGGRLPAWFVVQDDNELLFVEQDPGRDPQIKAILARTHGTPVIEGC
ncbi:MAG: hypothetical protein Q4G46_09375 [Propionibacteriaceae bacterium]|nr:hypothetical protein [Propionibacteriaceae bacterium]